MITTNRTGLESELDALTLVAKEYDEFRTNAAASEATWKQNAMQEQYELRKQTLATELSLCNRIDDLEQSLANEAADHHAEYDTLACSFERYRHRMQSRLGRTLKYLNAYMERRVEIFADANLYTISAFNTEGKRIAWNIPAPALTRNCSFEYVPDEESSDDESTAVTTPVGEGEASAMPANAKSGFQRPPTPPLDTVRSSRRKRRQLHAHVALSSLAQLPSTSSANSDYAQPSAFFKSLGEHARPATPNGGGYRLPTGNQSPNHSGSSSPPASPLERATFLKLHRMDSDVSTTFNCISRPRLNSAPPDVLLQRISSATVKQLLLTNQSADDADTGMPSSVTTVKTKSCASLAIEKRPVSGLAELEKFTVTPPTAPLSNETASSDSEDDARYQRLLTATPESDGNQPDQIFGMVQWLVDQNLQQLQQIQLLAAKVDEMSYLNKTMGEKVRQFSEELINQKPKRGATFRISSKFSKR